MFQLASRVYFPQIDQIDDISSLQYISIGKVLFDIKRVIKSLTLPHNRSSNTVIWFYNFNALLSILGEVHKTLEIYKSQLPTIDQVVILTVIEGNELAYPTTVFEQFVKLWNVQLLPVSHYTRDVIQKYTSVPMTVFPHCIDTSIFCPSPVCNQDVSQLSGFKFLFVGTDTPRKNIQLLLDSFEDAFSGNESVRLLLKVGPKYVLPKPYANVSLLPDVSELLLSDIYRAVDCFVLPTKCEGFGLPVLEALCCGLPVIAPYHSGITTICKKEDLITLDYTEELIPESCRSAISNGKGIWYSISKPSLVRALTDAFLSGSRPLEQRIEKAKPFVRNFHLLQYSGLFDDLSPSQDQFIQSGFVDCVSLLPRNGTELVHQCDFSMLKLLRYIDWVSQNKFNCQMIGIGNKPEFLPMVPRLQQQWVTLDEYLVKPYSTCDIVWIRSNDNTEALFVLAKLKQAVHYLLILDKKCSASVALLLSKTKHPVLSSDSMVMYWIPDGKI